MDLLFPFVIASGLGIWTYLDAKALDRRGVRVRGWAPVAWGALVFLVAIVFGILYLVSRPKAVAGGVVPIRELDPEPVGPRRFCPRCGTEIVPYAAYCHGCGHELERISP